jgi:uncharacterized protein (UPF0332 family)
MSFDWSGYLILAQELASASTNSSIKEAYLRSAISRAYYAAFCIARNHLIYKDKHSIPNSQNVHWYVVDKFENSGDTTRETIGQFLRHLRSTRNIIDYRDTFSGNLPGRTKAALEEAEEIIRLLSTL